MSGIWSQSGSVALRYFIRFIGLFNDNVSISDYTAPHFWMTINWKGCGRRRSWHNLRYWHLEWTRNTTKKKLSGLEAYRPKFEPSTYQTQVRNVTTEANSNHVSVQPFKAQLSLPCNVYFTAAGAIDLFLLRNVQTGSGILTGSYSKGTGFLSGDKAVRARLWPLNSNQRRG
jgi:hypothetical protein